MAWRSRRMMAGVVVGVVALMATAVACSSDDDEGGEGGGTISVTLQEFSVIPSADSAPAGSVTFELTNEGPEDTHEFVIFKTDLAPDALPTDETGAVDEEGEGIEVVDEVEDLAVGDEASLPVDLEAGSYVLVCNIYDEDEQEAHYQEGMRTAFTVE